MVDVGGKLETKRTASAQATVYFSPQAYQTVKKHVERTTETTRTKLKKGDLLTVAQIAGIQGCKKTSDLIPMCHQLALDKIDVAFEMMDNSNSIKVTATCSCTGKTGVEMEAMTGVTIASLTIYDMCKAIDKSIRIDNVHLVAKEGGKSGTYHAQ